MEFTAEARAPGRIYAGKSNKKIHQKRREFRFKKEIYGKQTVRRRLCVVLNI